MTEKRNSLYPTVPISALSSHVSLLASLSTSVLLLLIFGVELKEDALLWARSGWDFGGLSLAPAFYIGIVILNANSGRSISTTLLCFLAHFRWYLKYQSCDERLQLPGRLSDVRRNLEVEVGTESEGSGGSKIHDAVFM